MFLEYGLAELNGFDKKYSYILKFGNTKFVNPTISEIQEGDYQHFRIMQKAAEENVYYERKMRK